MENKDIQFHITVKGIVIYEGKTLILKRVRPSSDGLGYWELPGGGLEYGDQVKISFEHTDYKFVDEDELEKTLDPHIFNDIKKTIEEYNQIREYNELKREAN